MSKNEINLTQFQSRFSTEEACVEHLFSKRWPNGYVCPRCGHDHYSFHSSRRLYQCSACKYQVSVTAGTVFHGARTPLKKWFWMIFLMTRQKSGVSMMSLQRMLGIKSYKTIWTMGHKIRKAMAEADDPHGLGSIIKREKAPLRSNDSTRAETDTRGRGGTEAPSRTRMGEPVSKNANRAERRASQEALGDSDPESRVSIDGASHGVSGKKKLGRTECASDNVQDELAGIRWAPVLVSNLKGNLRGVHHGVSSKHLKRYVSEFVYRFNHRFGELELFGEALTACASSSAVTYAELSI